MITSEDYEKFATWQKKEHKGQPQTEKWFEEVQTKHQDLRDRLASIKHMVDVTIEATSAPANAKASEEIIKTIKACRPGIDHYMQKVGVTDKDFLLPELRLGSHNGMRTSKWIKTYLALNTNTTQDENEKRLDKALAKLGDLWAKAKTTEATYRISVTTGARAFMKLGHYGIDDDSCFKNGGGSENNKYRLATKSDTYVILIEEDGKVQARMWGFPNHNYRVWNVSNLYTAKGTKEGNILKALRLLFADLNEVNESKIQEVENNIRVPEGIYHNPYFRLSFSDESSIPLQILTDREKPRACPDCAKKYCGRGTLWQRVDGREICATCARNAKFCLAKEIYTLKPTFEVKVDGGTGYITDTRDNQRSYPECSGCGTRYPRESMQSPKRGTKLCSKCVATVKGNRKDISEYGILRLYEEIS